MNNQKPNLYQEISAKGYSRREFLQFCATMAAFMGVQAPGLGQIVKAL
jgi:hydrogenase small subunit